MKLPKLKNKKKENQPQQKPKPAEEKKKSEKKKKEEEEEDEDEEYKEELPKGPNPLDLLPPTTFNLDEWKRVYSNSDVAVSIPWFWEKFDREGWSLWFSDYKYNNELTQLYRTSNLILGFLQRLDKLRKYGFGSILIFEVENGFEISGCWLFRGQDVPSEMKDCDDYELYNWHKVDVDNADEKKKVDAYFAWAGDFGGKKFNDQGKIFK
jgi:elongation factor 1-gamma